MTISNQREAMFSFQPARDDSSTALLRLVLAGIVGLGIAIAALDPFGGVRLAVLVVAGAAFLIWSAIYTSRHHEWLFFALLMVEVLASSAIFPDDVTTVGRYGLEALFCLPVLPAFLRSDIWRKGGFRLFFLYMAWALVTVSYSIAPLFSLGRMINTSLLVAVVCLCASEIKTSQDLNFLLGRALVGCSIILGLVLVAAVLLPTSITWQSNDIVNESGRVVFSRGGMLRFQGFLGSPNQIGEVMLTTMAVALIYWNAASSRIKILLVCLMVLAFGLMALADSRTSAAAILAGGAAYAVFKYRFRAILAGVGLILLLVIGLILAGPKAGSYVNRDVTSFTGRSEIWAFTVDQIEQSPLLGYGYEVEGAILDNKYFPLWYGPWDMGPHTSLHEDYLARAVGVGVPAALLWFFIMLRPWIVLFQKEGDPLGLKRFGLLAALPIFILNFSESSAADCRYSVGLLMMLAWALAENQRLHLSQSKLTSHMTYLFAPAS
jgi:O-antigen ligase